nr:11462_t:CDS:2 [Entrophospora candida]
MTKPTESSSSVIIMWILLEGKQTAMKVRSSLSHTKDLDDLRPIIRNEFNELQNINNSNIEFFSKNNSLHIGMVLTELSTTDENPLVVRYTLSNADSNGSWVMLKEIVKEKFQNVKTSDFYFVSKTDSEEKIENEFQFNRLVVRTDQNDRGERLLDLKVQIKGKKAYGDWTLKEVSRDIYNNEFDSIGSMSTFKVEEIHKRFGDNLREKLNVFHNEITINEAIARDVEVELDGSHGYGILDYAVYIQEIPILVTEAKLWENDKAIAQNLVQIHSVAESLLGKRKQSKIGSEQVIFGIVTTGRSWRFICWSGTLESPKIEITVEHFWTFEDNMKGAKNVVTHIMRILQAQAKSLENNKNQEEQSTKHLCTDQDKLA